MAGSALDGPGGTDACCRAWSTSSSALLVYKVSLSFKVGVELRDGYDCIPRSFTNAISSHRPLCGRGQGRYSAVDYNRHEPVRVLMIAGLAATPRLRAA